MPSLPQTSGLAVPDESWAATFSRTVTAPEVLLYAAITLAMALLALSRAGGPFLHALSDDSYQYLSVAENLRREGSAATSIVHFDSERAHGRIPAPVTTFPPGYPALISLLSMTGIAPEWAGVLISIASSIAVVLLLRHAGQVLGLAPLGQRLTMALWAFSAQVSLGGSYLLTESLFTASITAGIVLLLPRQRGNVAGWRTVIACALIGLGWWVRYAGLFFVVLLNIYALWTILRERTRRWVWAVGLVLCDGIVVVGLARNLIISGTWRGGSTRFTLHSAWTIARDMVFMHAAVALGSVTRRPSFLIPAVVVLIGGAMTAVAWARIVRLRRERSALRPAIYLFLFFITGYTVALFYAGLTMDVGLEPRYVFPTLPLFLLLVGAAATVASQTAGAAGRSTRVPGMVSLIAFLVAYVAANLDVILHTQRVAPHSAVTRALALPGADGRTLSAWIEANVSPRAVLLASSGQATGYVLKRNTVSFVSKNYSDISWDDIETRRIAKQFGASYVLVYHQSTSANALAPNDHVLVESQFLARLAANRAPSWLELAASTPGAALYHVRTSSVAAGSDASRARPDLK